MKYRLEAIGQEIWNEIPGTGYMGQETGHEILDKRDET